MLTFAPNFIFEYMIQRFIAAGAFCLLTVLGAQAQDIATARAAAVGSTVTFRGVALNGPELPNIRYIQDGTAGIAVYGTNLTTINTGDSVLITGTMTNYNNLAEVTPATFTDFGPVALPAVQLFSDVSLVADTEESELLGFDACFFTNGGGTFAGNTNYAVTVNGQTLQVRVLNGSPLIGQIIPSGEVNLTGILSQYCTSPATGCTSGYQLLLRTLSDMVSTSSIYLTNGIQVSNIQTTSFDINWSTNIAGTNSYVQYGLTPALELGTIPSNNAVNHTVTINGLTPATIYYVKASSWNTADSAVTLERPFATQSLSTGDIKAYFNRYIDDSYSSGTTAQFLNQVVADTLAAYMDRATTSLDVCIYNWDNSLNGTKILTAVNAAQARGVKVRVIYDGSTFNAAINNLNAQIPTRETPQGADYTIMHNKFVIIDANATNPNLPIVWTGSTNFTSEQLLQDANNVIIFQDQSLARGYKMEFDEMWGDSSQTSQPNLSLGKFGQFKTDNTPHEYVIGGKRVESYFSPSDQTNAALLKTITTANSDLYFCIFTMTRSDVAYGIKDQITLNSLASKGMVDDQATSSTPFGILSPTMGSNIAWSGQSWILHHKYLIVDQSNTSSDPLVFTGSHNWSSAADQKNDENTVVVHDATIANEYYQEFMGRWCERNGGNCLAGLTELNGAQDLTIYPNPNKGTFSLNAAGDGTPATLAVVDITGKQVYTAAFATVNGSNAITVATPQLQKGMYVLQWTISNQTITKRLVIE